MRLMALVPVLLSAFVASPAAAQAPPPSDVDPGVTLQRIIVRPEVRVSRVTLQPGAARAVHAHDEVKFHLWVPMTGSLQLSIGSEAPVTASAGQAFFLARNTQHGFKNAGTTPATVLEVFINNTPASAAQNFAEALAVGLEAIQNSEFSISKQAPHRVLQPEGDQP
jgi:quercetin dioxygenase-like cupin family protein